jgi:hypothetical protein
VSLTLASAAALPAQAESPFLVPYYVAQKPIIHAQGRKQVIIDFVDDAHINSPKDPPPGWDARVSIGHRLSTWCTGMPSGMDTNPKA